MVLRLIHSAEVSISVFFLVIISPLFLALTMAQKNKNKKPGGGGDTGGAGGGSGGLGITKADCEKVKQTSQSRFGGLILMR